MKKIGMIIPTTDNSFFSFLGHQVQKQLREDEQLFLCDSSNSSEKEKEYLKTLSSFCDGIIDVSGLSELGEGLLNENYPMVLVDRKPVTSREIPWVGNDDSSAMEEATEYLIHKGCKNILLMPGYIAEKQENPRISGYRKALENNGLQYDESFVLNRKGVKSSEEETAELVMGYFRKGIKIDGIITSSDRAAFGAVKALGRLGYYVPEDVRLISFDNSPYSLMASPSITSIDRNGALIAQKALETLRCLLEGNKPETETVIPVSLVKNDSTR
ncbi:MAG: substrate-binding domain-containing protein [Erysipelotrichaceae bacterium]|nr:substrate-binding domain-containing protein [Erysipelotrichaceae bacterium]